MKISLLGKVAAVLLLILPFFPRFGLLSGAVTGKFFLVLGVIHIALLLVAVDLVRQRSMAGTIRRPFLLSLIAIVVVQGIAALVGAFPEYSLLGDSSRATSVLFLSHLVVWAVILGEFLTPRDWGFVRKSVLIGAAGVSLLSIIGLDGFGYTGTVLGINFSDRGVSFGNETFAGIYLLLALIIGGVEILKTKNVLGKVFLGIAATTVAVAPILSHVSAFFAHTATNNVLTTPALLLGSTRASSTVLFASLMFLVGWWLTTKIPLTRVRIVAKTLWSSLAVGACLVGFLLFILPGSLVQKEYADETTYSRFLVWEIAKEAVNDKPVFGWGPENFSRAFEQHIDPALYQIGEADDVLFDRAHNVVLDTLVTSGVVGTLSFIVMLAMYVLVMWRARRRGDIGEGEYVLWLLLPVAHIVQLSTAFDVIPTLVLLAVVAGYALSLEREQHGQFFLTKRVRGCVASVLCVLAVLSFSYTFLYEMPRQLSLVTSLSSSRIEERGTLITFGTSRLSDFEGLRRTSTLFVGSVQEQLNSGADRERVDMYALKYLEQYLTAHEKYVLAQPAHYRAEMNYAYLLLVKTFLHGGDETARVLEILQTAERWSPQNPSGYLLSIVAHAYRGDFVTAHARLTELEKLIPSSVQVEEMKAWLESQQSYWPTHIVPVVRNL